MKTSGILEDTDSTAAESTGSIPTIAPSGDGAAVGALGVVTFPRGSSTKPYPADNALRKTPTTSDNPDAEKPGLDEPALDESSVILSDC
jgi:hypothetical protein